MSADHGVKERKIGVKTAVALWLNRGRFAKGPRLVVVNHTLTLTALSRLPVD
jgi:hypothetical protein